MPILNNNSNKNENNQNPNMRKELKNYSITPQLNNLNVIRRSPILENIKKGFSTTKANILNINNIYTNATKNTNNINNFLSPINEKSSLKNTQKLKPLNNNTKVKFEDQINKNNTFENEIQIKENIYINKQNFDSENKDNKNRQKTNEKNSKNKIGINTSILNFETNFDKDENFYINSENLETENKEDNKIIQKTYDKNSINKKISFDNFEIYFDKDSSSYSNQNNTMENMGKTLIDKIERKSNQIKKDKFQLIPPVSQASKFLKGNVLKTVYKTCNSNLNVTKRLFKIIGVNNKKPKSLVKQEMKKKEKEKNVERDIKIDTNKDKVFIYGKDGDGGNYITGGFGHFEKYNVISKMSFNMAVNNRNFLIDQLSYDYSKDHDYMYKQELQDKFKAMKRELEEQKEKGKKHHIVDEVLDVALKKSEILSHRLDYAIMKYGKDKGIAALEEIKELKEKEKDKEEKQKKGLNLDGGKTWYKKKH